MALGFAVSTIKYILLVFNVLFAILSAVIVGVAAAVIAKSGDLNGLYVDTATVPVVLLIVGVITFAIAVFGGCGAIRESQNLLKTYYLLLVVLLVGKIILFFVIVANKEKIALELRDKLQDKWERRDAEMAFWNVTQNTLKCCGLDAPNDWNPTWISKFPPTCCEPDVAENCVISKAYPDGCSSQAKHALVNLTGLLGELAIVAAIVEITGVVFAVILFRRVRKGTVSA